MKFLMIFIALVSITLSGCQQFSSAPLTEVDGACLCQYVESNDRNVLVEFGVQDNCGRCESMKESVVQLAKKYKNYTEVIRVDFASNIELAQRYGATVCPTYVLFEKGHSDPMFVQSFPAASKDSLEADLLALLALDDEE